MDTLVQLSRQILLELDAQTPSVDDIESLIIAREQPSKKLGELSVTFDSKAATDEQLIEISERFKEFEDLNKMIIPKLHALRNKQGGVVNRARLHTQAQHKYHGTEQQKVLEKPDISYYK
ncbi:MAG: hypothetical protein LAT52_06675 [Balneolales bacterium]|nr:hypothetical protein [Balneolales bacterium]